MTDLRKAAEMALDALEFLSKNELPKKGAAKAELDEVVIPTLRQALAHEEKPLVKSYCGGKPNYCTTEVTPDVDAINISAERVDETAKGEQEPVAWMWKDGSLTSDPDEADGTWTKLYTASPKREWVGLTDEEIENLWEMAQAWNAPKHFYILIAAKLKEKNA